MQKAGDSEEVCKIMLVTAMKKIRIIQLTKAVHELKKMLFVTSISRRSCGGWVGVNVAKIKEVIGCDGHRLPKAGPFNE